MAENTINDNHPGAATNGAKSTSKINVMMRLMTDIDVALRALPPYVAALGSASPIRAPNASEG